MKLLRLASRRRAGAGTKKEAGTYVAPRFDTTEQAVEAAFKKVDVDSSGSLSVEELAELVKSLGSEMEEDELTAALAALDEDASGTVEYTEFLEWWKTTL